MVQIDGVILAGGKSSRMNGNYKGNLIYDNETFVEKIISELGKMHPLAAIYRTNIAVSLEEELKKKHFKMQKVCRQLNLRYVDVSDSESYRQMLTNINTVEEYIEVIKGKERGRQR